MVAARRGRLAALLESLGAPFTLARQRSLRPRAAVRRGGVGGVPFLEVALAIPASQYGQAARALAGGLAEVCASHRGMIGSVTVVAGEEPALVSLAPRLDAVAERLHGILLAGESHRFPHLLLLLAPQVYLAQVVDPYSPLEASPETMARLLASGKVPLATRLTVQPRRRVVEVALLVLGEDRQALRRAWRVAREAAGGVGGGRRVRGTAAAARAALNSRLQA